MTARYEPTETQKIEVAALVSFGVTHDEIANYLSIDEKTMVKHFKRELTTAHIKANAAVARCLYHKAVVDKDVTSIIFWLKTRAKWREIDRGDDSTQKQIHDDALKNKLVLAEANKKEY